MTYNYHNKYNIKVIKNGNIVEEKNYYNKANTGIYLQMSNGTPSERVSLICEYTEDEEGSNENEQPLQKFITFETGVLFSRTNAITDINYGQDITFVGGAIFSGFEKLENRRISKWSVALGTPLYEDGEDGTRIPHYWSEVNNVDFSDTVDRNTIIQMTITINFVVTAPGIRFALSMDSILNDSNRFPNPFVGTFNLSPLINYPEVINKQIPTTHHSLPVARPYLLKWDRQGDVITQENNIGIEGLFINTNGLALNGGTIALSNMNVGSMPTLVYNNITATHIEHPTVAGKSTTINSTEMQTLSVPVAELNYSELTRLINELEEDGNESNVYLYASIPEGTNVVGVKINNLLSEYTSTNEYEWINLPEGDLITLDGSITDYLDSEHLNEVNNTVDNNLFYSNFILSRSENKYWQPSSGCPVTPTCIKLPNGQKPTNYRMGSNIQFYIEGKKNDNEDENWKECKLINPGLNRFVPYKVYYLEKENYDEYRVRFTSIPNTNDFGFYVNNAEVIHIQNKTYDKNVVLIGTGNIYDNGDLNYDRSEGHDIGRCGVKISKSQLEDLRDRLAGAQNSSYYISAIVSGSPKYFYKTKDNTALLCYSITATANS